MFLLVGEVLVAELLVVAGLLDGRERPPGHYRREDRQGVGDRRAVAGERVAQTERGVGEGFLEDIGEPSLLVCVPCAGDVVGRQPAGGCRLAQIVRTLVAESTRYLVAPFIGIGACSEVSQAADVGIRERIIVCSFLLEHLEGTVVELGNLACVEHHAPFPVEGLLAVYAVGLHTCIEVHDVRVVEDIVVGCRETRVPAEEVVAGAVENTAFRQDRFRQSERIVRVGIEVGIGIADGRRPHGPVSQCLVGVLAHDVFHRRGGALDGHQGGELHLRDGLVVDARLDAEVVDIEVHVVVVQLVEDVERRIVAGVEHVGVECTRRVQRVGVGVDVERPAHGSRCRVDGPGQRARCALLAVRGVGDEVQAHLLADVVGGVEVAGVTLYTARLVPSGVVHGGEGGIVLSFVRTARCADGVVVHDGT